MINLTVPVIAFALSLLFAAWLAGRLQRRGVGSKRSRVLQASLPVPLVIVLASGAGIVWELTRTRTGENMTDLAVAVYLTVGGLFALVTLAGGLIGALHAERRPAQ
jgi:hypothetical protein